MCPPEPRRNSPVGTESSSLQFIKTSVGFKEPLRLARLLPPQIFYCFFILNLFQAQQSSNTSLIAVWTPQPLPPPPVKKKSCYSFFKVIGCFMEFIFWLFILFNGPVTSSFHLQLKFKFPSNFFFINSGSLCFHFLSIFSLENFLTSRLQLYFYEK